MKGKFMPLVLAMLMASGNTEYKPTRQMSSDLSGGNSFNPKRKKLKGYMKQQGRKKGYHKFNKYK